MDKVVCVKQALERVLEFFEPFSELANAHMVDYFTKNIYSAVIPPKMQEEIKSIGESNIFNLLLNNQSDNRSPELNKFVENSNKCSLKNMSHICLNFREMMEIFSETGYVDIPKPKLEIFVTPKKSHEVEILSSIAAALKSIRSTSHLVDVGDGKGYLSSLLALHYKIPVLGVDASVVNTEGACKRVEKLKKIWKGIEKKPRQSVPPKNVEQQPTDSNLYKQITQYVDESTNFEELISSIFKQKTTGLGLVGLHTCGSLASTCLKLYSSNNCIKTICNVSCCYHLITEEFEGEVSWNDAAVGFPMSNFLRNKSFVLGRNARMLASQSFDRLVHTKFANTKSIFLRALYQVFLERNNKLDITKKNIRRLKKDYDNFYDYVEDVSKKIGVEILVSEQDINDIYNIYKSKEMELNLFYLLRCKLASVVESLVLLDRLLFLLENGFENSYLVLLFDPVVSPRCYGLVSYK